jgi:hypothetical protein
MKKEAIWLIVWAALIIVSCKRNDDPEIVVVKGRVMLDASTPIENLDIELVKVSTGRADPNAIIGALGAFTTDEKGKFRFEYERDLLNVGGATCNEEVEGLKLRRASGGQDIFTCFPSNQDISGIFYTNTTSLLRLEIIDTIGAGDTLFVPYPPLDDSDPHFIEITDTLDRTYPYFFVVGPKSTYTYQYETALNNQQYNGFKSTFHGPEFFQWFVSGDSTYNTRLEDTRLRGKPYRDTITITNLYINN